MGDVLERPSPSGVLTQWTPQPVAIVVAVLLVAAYAVGLRRLGGRPWPAWRTSLFGLGVVLLVWAGCGFLQVYSDSLYWV
ncbi:MAG: cytochrome c oxidase assembly protein, partial [Actinobacteria bacterium]|nr:cytochrome c oxidase assembly protein [Actinomycetota bacterium]